MVALGRELVYSDGPEDASGRAARHGAVQLGRAAHQRPAVRVFRTKPFATRPILGAPRNDEVSAGG